MSAAARLNHAVTKAISQTSCRGPQGRFVKKMKPRAVILEALRQEYAPKLPEPIVTAEEISALTVPPQVEPRLFEVPLDAVEGKNHSTDRRTGAHRASGETNWRATGGSARIRVPETADETGPHPALTPPPSAAGAARTGRAACLIVLLVAVATACIFNDTVAAAISAGPIPLLWHGFVGRFA